MIIAIVLFFALIFLLGLTLWSMRRLRRAQFLRLLAALMRRRMPLEPSLAGLSAAQSGFEDEALVRKSALQLADGLTLPQTLCALKVLTRQQAVALAIAQEYGAAAALLERLAEHASRIERRFLQTIALTVYPLAMGFVLWLNVSFLVIFIMPKFQQMLYELNVSYQIMDVSWLSYILVGVLVFWGVLAFTLQNILIGRYLWWRVPFAGLHFHLLEQATLARNLALMLSSGAPLERALQEVVGAQAGGPLQKSLAAIARALANGEPPLRAFREHGAWRPELLWALEALAQGAPPGTTLDTVAEVLEDKANVRLNRIQRFCTPIAVIIAAVGVGTLGWTIFGIMAKIDWSLML